MSKPSDFFKKVPKEKWNEELKNRAAEYDKMELQHATSGTDTLTGEKLLEIADDQSNKQKEMMQLISNLESTKKSIEKIIKSNSAPVDNEDLKSIDKLIEKYKAAYKNTFEQSPTTLKAH
jgi:hypothetical protein